MASNCPAPAVASTSGSTSSDNSNDTEAVQEVNSPNFGELSETEKPQARVTTKCKQDDFQAKML